VEAEERRRADAGRQLEEIPLAKRHVRSPNSRAAFKLRALVGVKTISSIKKIDL
jgi:hypothetical protein